MATKTCWKCGKTKAVSEFFKRAASKDGLQSQCKACGRAYYQAKKEEISERERTYREANKEEIAERKRAYREANKERLAEKDRAYREANKEKIAEKDRAYREANKEEVAAWKRAYKKRRLTTDPAFAMVYRLRNRLRRALDGKAKPATTMELVGCSPEKLCAWLEMHFAEGMTWENRSEWHIDHIRPVASFEDPADPACWHWSNLQPLWAEDNLRKGDSFDGE